MNTAFFEENDEILPEFLTYFESTWIRSYDRLFGSALWNCFQSVLVGLAKINNVCEGYSRATNSMLSASHPTIYKLPDCLKIQEALANAKIEKLITGDVETPGLDKYKRTAEKLRKVVATFDIDDDDNADQNLLEYLR